MWSRTIQATLAVLTLMALFILGTYRFILFEGTVTSTDVRSFSILAVTVVLLAITVNRTSDYAMTTSFMFYFSLIFVTLWGFDLFIALKYFSTSHSMLIISLGLITSVLVSGLLFPKARNRRRKLQTY